MGEIFGCDFGGWANGKIKRSPATDPQTMEMKGRSERTLCTAPAVLSINAGFQPSSVEMAVKPAKVMPAANGC